MSTLLTGLVRVDKATLTDDDRHNIVNHIGCLAGMCESITDVLGDHIESHKHSEHLALTASLLAEIIAELNALLQTPPKSI